jgi:hypothetical protein
MASDSKLPFLIFAALVALIAIPFVIDHLRELRRPVLLEARVVSSGETDPVFRTGRRRVAAGEAVEVALALRIGRRGTEGRWFAPADRLVIDGHDIEDREDALWPVENESVRVFWFSVESANLGGSLNADNAGQRLQYRTFLAPEMGRGLRALQLPETHSDDHIGESSMTAPESAGTFRIYARAEIVESDSDVRPLQAVTSLGVEAIFDEAFPTIHRSADFGDGIHPAAGELLGLPGFEPRPETGEWNEVTVPAFERSFTDLVADRLVVSSRTLAAVAITGMPAIDDRRLTDLGQLSITADEVLRRGRKLHWDGDVQPGDLLVEGDHWWVLLADDGNGQLDPADSVLHCWGRPPERTTLFASLETESTTVDHRRYAE